MDKFRINQPVAFDSLGRHWCGRVHAKHLNGELTVKVQLEVINPFLLVIKPEMLRPLDSYEWARLPEPVEGKSNWDSLTEDGEPYEADDSEVYPGQQAWKREE